MCVIKVNLKLEVQIMKITLEKLPFKKKTYDIKQSVKNMRKTYKLQLVFSQNGDMENKTDEELVEQMLDTFDEAIDYVSSLLKLNDKQTDALEDLSQDELLDTANTIAMKLMGIKEEDVKEDNKKK